MGFSYTTTGQEEASSLLPIGEYPAKIIKSTEKISKSSGNNMIELEIDTGRGHLWDYLVEGGKNTGSRIREILESCGKYKPGMQINSATFQNLIGRVMVKHETKDGETRAKINSWIKTKPGTAPAPAAENSTPANPDEIPF